MQRQRVAGIVWVVVEVVKPFGVEGACPPDDAVNLIALCQQQFG
jgi:hypothetical protein